MRVSTSFGAIVFGASIAVLPPANAQTGAVSSWNGVMKYPNQVSSLQSVDFNNFKYNLGGATIALKDGKMSRRYKPYGGTNAQLEHTWLFDVRDGSPRHALVSLYVINIGASSAPDGYVLLFEVRNGRLVETQELSYNAQASGTGATFDASSGKLIVTGRSDDDTPNCCPVHLDVATFTWNGAQFLPNGYKVVPVQEK
jgi:hypothetical protein